MRFFKPTFILFCLGLGLWLIGSYQSNAQSETPPTQRAQQVDQLISKAEEDGTVRVIVGLSVSFEPAGNLSRRAERKQQAEIANAQEALLERFTEHNLEAYAVYETIPYMALSLDAAALRDLSNSSLVTSISEDALLSPSLGSSTRVIGAPTVWADGHEGTDQAIVIIDTGIKAAHSFFGGRVVAEACFSNGDGDAISLCPNGSSSQTGSGAASTTIAACFDDPLIVNICSHGTHVAGIAAGNGSSFDGVARGADIIAIQVFTRIYRDSYILEANTSDIIKALQYVYDTLDSNHNIAVVNMSLAYNDRKYTDQTQCDSDNAAIKAAIDNLRSKGIATVISSGNHGYKNALAAPACISSAVAVGATTDDDMVAEISNSHQMVDLLAPGVDIESSASGPFPFMKKDGTSVAAPHVAGAWAVLKGIQPSATIDEILSVLQNTGIDVTDDRPGGSVTKPRIQLDAAVDEFAPSITGNPNQLASTLSANATEMQTLNINNNGGSDLTWTIDEQLPAREPISILEPPPFAAHQDGLGVAKSISKKVTSSAHSEPVETFGQMARLPSGGTRITHSNSQTIQSENSIACHDESTGYHAENRYSRGFNLANDFSINHDFNVTAVEFGVQSAVGIDGTQPIIVNLYKLNNGDIGLIGTTSVNLPDQALTIVSVPVNGTVPAGWILFVQIVTPDGRNEGNSFLIGSNSAGQTDPSYIYAPDCNFDNDLSDLGWPNMHIVMNVLGNERPPCVAGEIPWVSVSPTSGTTSAGSSSQVNVTFNTNGLAAGTYTGNLCLKSNDPQNREIEVPLTLVVQEENNPTPTSTPSPNSTPTPSPTPNPSSTPTPSPNSTPTPSPTPPPSDESHKLFLPLLLR